MTLALDQAASEELLGASSPATGDVAFAFSHLTWDAASRRGWFGTEDRLAKGLVTHERVSRLLVCDRARSLPLKLLRDRFSERGAPFPADECKRLLSPVRLRRTDPASLRGAGRAFRAYDRAMERAAADMGLDAPTVITTNPLLAGFAELSWARAVTYYALDDWPAHPAYRRWWPAYLESYELMRARKRRVAAVSAVLLDRLRPAGPSAVVPNGVEPEEWRDTPESQSALTASPRPLLVYAGTLDARLNVTWLLETARSLPDGTLALVGPVVDADHVEPLRAEPNIAISPSLDRGELSKLVRAADLGLIPHTCTALTEAMSPLKLYEYLAGGLPVVATDLEPMRGVDPRVVLVPEGGDFAAAAHTALALGRSHEQERRRFLLANSWSARQDALLDLALA